MHTQWHVFLPDNPRWLAPLLLAVLALLSTPSNAQPDNIQPTPTEVYRVDTRPPDDVFAHGFTSEGQLQNLLAHALGSSCDAEDPAYRSAWVSTTTNREQTLQVATQRLRQGNIPQTALNGGSGIWIYTITPDSSYLHVLHVLSEAMLNGRVSQRGYTPSHAAMLGQLISPPSTLFHDAEIVTHRVPPSSVRSARLAALNPEDNPRQPLIQPVGGVSNAGYRAPQTTMTNMVNNLNELVPPASIALYLQPAPQSCFMFCDGAFGAGNYSERERRSIPARAICQAKPSASRAFLGSED